MTKKDSNLRRQVIVAIEAELCSDVPIVRASAALALSQLDSAPSRVVDVILETLAEPDEDARINSVAAVCKLAELNHQQAWLQSVSLRDAMVICLGDQSPVVRSHSVRALTFLAPSDDTVVARLAKMFDDPEPCVRVQAVTSLLKVGMFHPWYRERVKERLGDSSDIVREMASSILIEFDCSTIEQP